MMSPTEKVRRLAMNPISSLIAGWQVKLPLAFIGGAFWNVLLEVGQLYGNAVDANPSLMLVTASLVIADMVAGLVRARRNGRHITSGRLRATGWKAIEYAAVVLVGLLMSAAIRQSFVPNATAIWGEAAMTYICITEGTSCIENILGKKKASRLLGGIHEVTGTDAPFQEEDTT